ncbi:hypothetical protein KQI91_15695 [Blautia sp. MSJ-19]|nr:hypothetical protein [Blautia sp. MSJ-19]
MEKREKRTDRDKTVIGVKIAAVVVLLVIAILSGTKIAGIVSSPDTYSKMITSLDAKTDQVKSLVTSATAASTAITAMPDDVGTPVADKIADMCKYFIVVLSALFLEKILLTTSGYMVFRWVVPFICILLILAVFVKKTRWKYICRRIALRLFLFGVVFWTVTPISVKLATIIENSHAVSIDESVDNIRESVSSVVKLTDAENEAADSTDATKDEENDDKGLLDTIISTATDLADNITASFSNSMETLEKCLGELINAFAILIVTTCLLPVIMLIILILVGKWVLAGVDPVWKREEKRNEH